MSAPLQAVTLGPATAVGFDPTVMTTQEVLLHPLTAVTVTQYVPDIAVVIDVLVGF